VVRVPRRKGGRRRVDPEVERVFDAIWQALAGALEGEAVYDVKAPFTTERVLEEVEERMKQELEDVLREKLTFVLCDACYCVPQHFTNYIFYGELPSRGDLEECISDYIDAIYETRESFDEYVKQINELYGCFQLLDKFFDFLPDLLQVEVVEGEVAPSLCSEEVAPEDIVRDTVWHVGFSTGITGMVGVRYYGVRDGRVVVLHYSTRPLARTCDEGFEEEVLPRLTSRLKELEGRPDAVAYVYGNPPVDPKMVVLGVTVRRLVAPPKP
jgi:hypothetical protein